jgi:hypothetical protein
MATVTTLVNNKSTKLTLVSVSLATTAIATIFPAEASTTNGSYILKSVYLPAVAGGTISFFNSVDTSSPNIIFNATAAQVLNLQNLEVPFTQGSAVAIQNSTASMGTAYLVFERKD